MEDLINLIANVGFPIAVAAYLLVRMENKMDQLTAAITALQQTIRYTPRIGSGPENGGTA